MPSIESARRAGAISRNIRARVDPISRWTPTYPAAGRISMCPYGTRGRSSWSDVSPWRGHGGGEPNPLPLTLALACCTLPPSGERRYVRARMRAEREGGRRAQRMAAGAFGTGDAVHRARRIFVSSTSLDLAAHRERVRDALLRLDVLPVGMEYFGAQGAGDGMTLNNLGLLAHDQGRKEVAARYYEQALAIFEEIGAVDSARRVRENLAWVQGYSKIGSGLRGERVGMSSPTCCALPVEVSWETTTIYSRSPDEHTRIRD